LHILFVHQNFPAQFGHIASRLAKRKGFRCTFVSKLSSRKVDGVRLIRFKPKRGATKSVHYCSRPFETCTWNAHAVYAAMKAHPEVKPDLIVGHSGFGSTLFLADLFDCPIINYFEYYYRGSNSDIDFRPDVPVRELDVLRARTRNAMILCDLQTCAAGYCPTEWQRSLFPREYQSKLQTIFDGIDREFWYRRKVPRWIGPREIPAGTRIVTYVSRGFQSMRGFDIFMKVAKRICEERKDVIFVVVGSDHICYGDDLSYCKEKTYREHVLAQDRYDLRRFIFTGTILPSQLVELFSLSDLHIYLTIPFVLSWSLMNALAVGCTVLASDTEPVREVIRHERHGLLADFYDVDALTKQALRVLKAPEEFRALGQAGTRLIDEKYSLTRTLPQMVKLYRQTVSRSTENKGRMVPSRPPQVAAGVRRARA
jgi:glycosyltransferase involved in cell wall biosynthesis